MYRPDKRSYYLSIAGEVAARSTCLRRQYGAVVVKDDEIIATGYNGAPRGEPNCCDTGECWRKAHNIPHGQQYEKCVAVHAEMNAIISAARRDMIGSTIYLVGMQDGHYNDCITLKEWSGLCGLRYRAPCGWRLKERPRWTADDIEDAKAIKRLYPDTVKVERCKDVNGTVGFVCGGRYYTSHSELFPRLAPGERVDLQEILDAEENLDERDRAER